MTVKLLAEHYLELLSLTGGCTGLSESTLVKMPHCWKSHVTAHFMNVQISDKISLSSRFTADDLLNKKNLYPWIGEQD